MKKLMRMFLMLAVVVCCMFVLYGKPVMAQGELPLNTNSITFTKDGEKMVEINDDYIIDQSKSKSSNEQVAKINFYGEGSCAFDVVPKGEGSCIITVAAKGGKTALVNVTVTKACVKDMLKKQTFAYAPYGSKTVEIDSLKGAKGKLVIGKESYTFTMSSEYKTIKLKKIYKLKTKYTITMTKDDIKVSKTGKVQSGTYFYSLYGARKKIQVKLYSPHKGDVVKIKYKGKTYTKKINKNYNSKYCKFSLKVKKTVNKKAKIKATIYNKYKQKLSGRTVNLTGGWWYIGY